MKEEQEIQGEDTSDVKVHESPYLTSENEQIYGALFKNNHAAMLLIDPETGSIVDANPAACFFYGYSHEDLTTMKMSEINIIQKDRLADAMTEAKLEKKNYFHFQHRLATGEIRDVETYSGPVRIVGRTLLYSIIHDITERKLAEAKTKESEQSLRAILSASPIGVCRLRSRVFDWVNDAMCIITGYSFEEFAGKNSRFLFENDEDYETSGSCLDSRGWCEARHRRKDGSIIEVFIQSAPIDGSSYISTVSDITNRKDAAKEQARMGKLESLGVLAGGIAHDFNNILTMVLGNVSLAKMYMDKDQIKSQEKLISAEQAIMRAKDLTQQLLTFSKGGTPVKKVLAINDLLKNVCQFTLTGTPIVCKFDFAPDLLPVEIDEGQITQVIGHIVINGHQAMPEGGTILIKGENVVISSPTNNLATGAYMKITITDEGKGIPEEHLGQIFDPYFTTKQKGSGLGLAVSYSIIKNHKGHITVESTLGVGTTFMVYLPIFERRQSTRKSTDGKALSSGGRVLVMDDEDSIRDIVGDILHFHGYVVDFGKNGEEAISLYQENKYDVVILDLTIPGGMGGKETIKELLGIDPNVKAIVSSGYSSDPIMSDYQKYGFKDVIAKPYRLEELGQVVQRVIAED